jgi:DNA-directed RNA polymerase subunit N (RpoN/RPB10)
VHVLARTCATQAACPGCGVVSRRVHSSYQRQLADTASGGQEVLVDLQVRRFFCSNRACAKTTFAEQVPGLSTRYGRRTCALQSVLQGVALGPGRPGRRPAIWQVVLHGGPVDAAAAHPRGRRSSGPDPAGAGCR